MPEPIGYETNAPPPEPKYKPYKCPSCFDESTFNNVVQSLHSKDFICLHCFKDEIDNMPIECVAKMMKKVVCEGWEINKGGKYT